MFPIFEIGPILLMCYYGQTFLQTILCSATSWIIFGFLYKHDNIISPPLPFKTSVFFLIPRAVYFVLEIIFSSHKIDLLLLPKSILQSYNFFIAFYVATFYFDGVEKNDEWMKIFEKKIFTKYYLVFFTLPIIVICSKI